MGWQLSLMPRRNQYTRLSNDVVGPTAGFLPGQLQDPASYNPLYPCNRVLGSMHLKQAVR